MLFLAAGGTPGRDQLGAIAGGYDACGSGSRRAAQRPQWWVIGCGCCSLLEHRSTDPYALDVVIGTLRTLELLPSTGHSRGLRSEEHTSELQSLMRISYAVFCLKKKKQNI